MIDQIGGRKVVAALIVIAVALAVVLLKGDLSSNLLTLLQTVFGAFVVGNGLEHVTDAVQARAEASANATPDAPAQPQVAVDPALSTKIDELHNQTAAVQGGIAQVQETLVAIVKRVFGGQAT